jgi:hypothetical protein
MMFIAFAFKKDLYG